MTFFKVIWALIWPPYRQAINRDYAWWKLTHATHHLLVQATCDRGDLDAARLMHGLAKEILSAMRSA